jgi:hypothetical protein
VEQPSEWQVGGIVERQQSADTVEKVAASLLQSTSKKIDLSDRPTSRSRASVKGKKTPENLMRETVIDFFNSIGRTRSDADLDQSPVTEDMRKT